MAFSAERESKFARVAFWTSAVLAILAMAAPLAFDVDPFWWRLIFSIALLAALISGGAWFHAALIRPKRSPVLTGLYFTAMIVLTGLVVWKCISLPYPQNYSKLVWDSLQAASGNKSSDSVPIADRLHTFSDAKLARFVADLARNLRQLEQRYRVRRHDVDAQYDICRQKSPENQTCWNQMTASDQRIDDQEKSEYLAMYISSARAARDELFLRLGIANETPEQDVQFIAIDEGTLAGADPLNALATGLEDLARRLPS